MHSCQLMYSKADTKITHFITRWKESNFHVEFIGFGRHAASWIEWNVWWYENKNKKKTNINPSKEFQPDWFSEPERLIMTWARGTLTTIGIFQFTAMCKWECVCASSKWTHIRVHTVNDAQRGSGRRERNHLNSEMKAHRRLRLCA